MLKKLDYDYYFKDSIKEDVVNKNEFLSATGLITPTQNIEVFNVAPEQSNEGIGFGNHYNTINEILCNILGFIALILIYFLDKDKKKKKILIYSLIPILIIMSYFSYENIFSIFPVFACLISFIAFLKDDEDLIRFIGIISAACWLVYAIIYKSFSAITFEIIIIISTTIAYLKNKKNQK